LNYYASRQRAKDQRWDYTCQNNDSVWPVGYCHAYRELEPMVRGGFDSESLERENAKLRQHQAKYHADGHPTADGACECYRQYLLDNELRLHGPPLKPDYLRPCAVCGEFTAGLAEVGHRAWHLCDRHRNREEVALLFGSVGTSASSY